MDEIEFIVSSICSSKDGYEVYKNTIIEIAKQNVDKKMHENLLLKLESIMFKGNQKPQNKMIGLKLLDECINNGSTNFLSSTVILLIPKFREIIEHIIDNPQSSQFPFGVDKDFINSFLMIIGGWNDCYKFQQIPEKQELFKLYKYIIEKNLLSRVQDNSPPKFPNNGFQESKEEFIELLSRYINENTNFIVSLQNKTLPKNISSGNEAKQIFEEKRQFILLLIENTKEHTNINSELEKLYKLFLNINTESDFAELNEPNKFIAIMTSEQQSNNEQKSSKNPFKKNKMKNPQTQGELQIIPENKLEIENTESDINHKSKKSINNLFVLGSEFIEDLSKIANNLSNIIELKEESLKEEKNLEDIIVLLSNYRKEFAEKIDKFTKINEELKEQISKVQEDHKAQIGILESNLEKEKTDIRDKLIEEQRVLENNIIEEKKEKLRKLQEDVYTFNSLIKDLTAKNSDLEEKIKYYSIPSKKIEDISNKNDTNKNSIISQKDHLGLLGFHTEEFLSITSNKNKNSSRSLSSSIEGVSIFKNSQHPVKYPIIQTGKDLFRKCMKSNGILYEDEIITIDICRQVSKYEAVINFTITNRSNAQELACLVNLLPSKSRSLFNSDIKLNIDSQDLLIAPNSSSNFNLKFNIVGFFTHNNFCELALKNTEINRIINLKLPINFLLFCNEANFEDDQVKEIMDPSKNNKVEGKILLDKTHIRSLEELINIIEINSCIKLVTISKEANKILAGCKFILKVGKELICLISLELIENFDYCKLIVYSESPGMRDTIARNILDLIGFY